jgi:N-6 DNA Methylase
MTAASSRRLGGWIADLDAGSPDVDGLVRVDGYQRHERPPEEVAMMERAAMYGAYGVFFEAESEGRRGAAQALIFLSAGPADDAEFAKLHQRLWSWGRVPLIYRRTPGLVQLFRCAHRADFVSPKGELVCRPFKTLKVAADVSAAEAWWDAERLRNGTLWDDPNACRSLLSASKSAHRHLVDAVADLHDRLKASRLLTAGLRRRLLILSLLIAYLEERGALPTDFFAQFRPGAERFFHVLADGPALVRMLGVLEHRFNGHVFSLDEVDAQALETSTELDGFSRLVEAREDAGGQMTLWALYSFRDLPVEVISHIYQLFVTDTASSIYTPPALVRLLLDEALSWSRIDRLIARNELILDPACGSGVFLVEAYKRLVLHWRSRNDWARPGVEVLRGLLDHIHGVDIERGAIELAAFSLCLALCDALEPEDIRAGVQLFPQLAGRTLIASCFFEAVETRRIANNIGVVVGNPPFESKLKTDGAKRSYDRYVAAHGALADKQVAYLFLNDSMALLAPGGVLSMLQQYNLLYNPSSAPVRQRFIEKWDLREILDFVSIRGLFSKGGADTKIVVIVAEASAPSEDRKILHAVFRRSGRADAEQSFDMHWLPRRELPKQSGPEVWRANLLGGPRALALVRRLKTMRQLREVAVSKGWSFGEGFVEGGKGISRSADHLIGQPLLPSAALTLAGIDRAQITTVRQRPIEGPRTRSLFSPPMLLIRELEDLPHVLWQDSYLTYKNQIVGLAGGTKDDLRGVADWLDSEQTALRAFAAGISLKLFTQRATNLGGGDILALPYPEDRTLDLSDNERIVAEDIVEHYRDFVRLGNEAGIAMTDAWQDLPAFGSVLTRQVNVIYKENPLVGLQPRRWPGAICYPFAFGGGAVDWTGADALRDRLDHLLHEVRGASLAITRIARIYDGRFVFFLKPDRQRYWLRSTALRDADDLLVDLRAQGF